MRNRRPWIALAGCIALSLAAPGLGQSVPQDGAKPFRGPLKPDLPLAKGYDEAAQALAMVDENPLIRWEYRVWCQTGYRSVGDEGTGQQVDALLDPERDMVSPNGFFHQENASKLMPPGGARFLDNAWYFGANGTGVVVVKTPDGLIMLDTLRFPEEFERAVLQEMPAAGLDPRDVKYIFLGHHHFDHIGGVNSLLKLAPNAKVVAAEPDVAIIEEARKALLAGNDQDMSANHAVLMRNARPKTPEEAAKLRVRRLAALPDRIDIVVKAEPGVKTGTMTVRIGPSTEAVAILAPGHTPGQMHVIVPVRHRGATHNLLVMSGNDQPSEAWQYALSTDYVRSVAAHRRADAVINTHAYQSAMFHHLRQLVANPDAPNPFLMGADGVDRFLGIFADCQRALHYRLKDGTWLAF